MAKEIIDFIAGRSAPFDSRVIKQRLIALLAT